MSLLHSVVEARVEATAHAARKLSSAVRNDVPAPLLLTTAVAAGMGVERTWAAAFARPVQEETGGDTATDIHASSHDTSAADQLLSAGRSVAVAALSRLIASHIEAHTEDPRASESMELDH
ncbi:MAG: hypothetical protein AAF648_09855 [Pseudomonadota bacterium]